MPKDRRGSGVDRPMLDRRSVAASLFLVCGCAGPANTWEPLATPASSSNVVTTGVKSLNAPLSMEAFGGRLWVRTTDGALISYALEGSAPAEVHLLSATLKGLHKTAQGRLWALTIDDSSDDTVIWEREENAWEPLEAWEGAGSPPLGIASVGDAPVVLTAHSLTRFDAEDEPSSRWLSRPLEVTNASITMTRAEDTALVSGMDKSGQCKLYEVTIATAEVDELECPFKGRSLLTSFVKDSSSEQDCFLASTSRADAGPVVQRMCKSGSTWTHAGVEGVWDALNFNPTPRLTDELFASTRPNYDMVAPARTAVLGLLADASGFWAATGEAVVHWSVDGPSVVTRHAVKSNGSAAPYTRENLAVLAAYPRFLLTATSSQALTPEQQGPALPACYRAEDDSDVLCFEPTQIVSSNGNSIAISSEVHSDGSVQLVVGEGRKMTLQRWGKTALLSRAGDNYRRAGVLLDLVER